MNRQITAHKRGDNASSHITAVSLYSRLWRQAARSTARCQICLILILVLLTVTACSNGHITEPTPEPTRLTALLFGKLVEVEGCLRVNEVDNGASYLLAWPPDFAVSMEEDTVHILDGSGKEIMLQIGEMARISGGEVHSSEYLDERVQQKLPANCSGPYWVVGSEIGSVVEETASTSVPQHAATSTPATQPDATPTSPPPVFWWELDALPVTLSAAPGQPEMDVVFFRADGLWHYDSALAQERRLVTWTADSGRYVPGSLVWSPHQARVAYLTYREDDTGAQQWANVAVVALDTGLTTALTAFPVFIPGGLAWSASGDALYAIGAAETGSDGAGWGLYTLPLAPDAPPEALLTENRAAASLSGPLQTTAEGHVAYLHFEPREIAIRQIDPRQGRVETLAHIPGSSASPFAAPYLAVAGQPALPENTELLYLLSGEQSGWEERAGLYRFAHGESRQLLAFEGGCGLEAGLGMGRMVAVGCGVGESAPLLLCDIAAETCHQLHEPLRDVVLPVINPEELPFAVVKFTPLGWQETRLYFTAIPYGPDLAGLSGALFSYDTQTGEVILLLSDLQDAALAAQAADTSAAGWIAFVGKD